MWLACQSTEMINFHKALRCLQIDASYKTWTLFLRVLYVRLLIHVLTSSENKPQYWWQVPNSNSSWFNQVSITHKSNIFISDHTVSSGKYVITSMCIRIPFWGICLRNLGCKFNELTSTYKQGSTVSIFGPTSTTQLTLNLSNTAPIELSSIFLLNLASGSYTMFW